MIDMTEEPVDENDFEFLLTNYVNEDGGYLACPVHLDTNDEYLNRLIAFIGDISVSKNDLKFGAKDNIVAFKRDDS